MKKSSSKMIFHLVTLVTLTPEVCALKTPEENSLLFNWSVFQDVPKLVPRVISFTFFKENSCLLFLYS